MAFYAKYPSTTTTLAGTSTVQGPGTAGTQSGGVLTVQGDPSGTPIPVSGSITATNPSIGVTGAAVPADATMVGGSDGTNLRAVKVSSTGVVSVDGSATTQPVSGTVTANAGTGTFAVSAASLPLPTGAATEATLAKLPLAQASTTSGQSGTLIQGAVTTAAPTYTTAQTNPLSLTTAGALRVDASGSTQPVSGTVAATQSGTWTVQPGNTANTTPWLATIAQGGNSATVSAGGALKVDASASTQPVSGTVAVTQSTSPWVENISQFGGNNVVTGTGTSGNGIPRVTVSSDSALASVTTVSTVSSVTAIANALPAGANTIGAVTQASGPWTVTGSGTAGTAATGVVTVQGIASMTPLSVTSSLSTSTAVFQTEGSIAFGSITNAYQTIFTPSAATKLIQMRNNTDAAISVSFDAGTTLNYVLDAGDQVSLDLLANQLVMSTTAIQIKYTVGAPTVGSVRINGAH